MVSPIVTVVVALVLIAIAWKVLRGLIKTVVLLAILVLGAIFVFGVHH